MKTMEEKLLEQIKDTEKENEALKEELRITQEALNFVIMNGGEN